MKIEILSVKLQKEKTIQRNLPKITSPSGASDFIWELIGEKDREHFIVLMLSSRKNINAVSTISIGSLGSTIVHPREVFKVAILKNSDSIIIAHNHPGGSLAPSKEDVNVTKRLCEVGNVLGIEVIDHIIVTPERGYTSFKEDGLI